MILYYSGTGNTAFVSHLLAKELGCCAELLTTVNPVEFRVEDNNLVIAFPVYAWGVPPVVLKFIRRLNEEIIRRIVSGEQRLWCVATCGDETGQAVTMFRKAIAARGADISGEWSVITPNVYVLLPGFDTDSEEVEIAKIEAIQKRVEEIAGQIRNFRTGDPKIVDVHKGSWPRLKTALVYPLFKKWGVNTEKWHSTEACISCGQCAAVCPERNIVMVKGHPKWGNNCDSCTACYHVCPVHAVEYGGITKNKGQYRCKRIKKFLPG